MKIRMFTVTTTLLLSIVVSLLILNQVYAQSFDPDPAWAGYTFYGHDSFYRDTVVAYESGSTAVLYVSIRNTYGSQINVSAVGISMNWGVTFNSTQGNRTNPVELQNNEYRIFTVTFTVPSSANVSNLFRWDYKIYVEHVNATGGDPKTKIETRKDIGLPYFVVYSADQVKCKQIKETISGITAPTWNSTKAEILWKKADNATNMANYYYDLGEFSTAATQYETALSLKNAAFAAEQTKGTRRDDAEISLLEAKAKNYEGLANYHNGMSNMWTLIGVALVLFAIGYIIRGLATLRKAQIPP